ncbi:hypothetical protein BDR26DRAFT_892133 [Obelidium mucronatum]|nr:hypothetical protein BDR26DRAFT_892133 [Obelidium mucronatum]
MSQLDQDSEYLEVHRTHSFRSRSKSPSSSQYADFLATEQAAAISRLEAANSDLMSQLATKDRIVQQLRTVETTNGDLSTRVNDLELEVVKLKGSLSEQHDLARTLRKELEIGSVEKDDLANQVAKYETQIKKLEDDLAKERQEKGGLTAIIEQLVQQTATSSPKMPESNSDLIANLQKENETLQSEIAFLKQENSQNEEALRQLLLGGDSPVDPIPQLFPQNAPLPRLTTGSLTRRTTVKGTIIPERSSSAIALINVLPAEGGDTELRELRQRAIEAQQRQWLKLKEENQQLRFQLAAAVQFINDNTNLPT